jgi:hypothetical protein
MKSPPTDLAAVGLVAGLRDLVTDDKGHGTLLDAQWLAFTLLGVTYFLFEVLADPAGGLPEIPAALLVLMGVSGGGYLSGKVLDPIGAKSDRGAPPPPITSGTTQVSGAGERAALAAANQPPVSATGVAVPPPTAPAAPPHDG